jgi:hypothetical protein
MENTKSANINFNFKQGIAWIVMVLLLVTPLLRFSWDVGPKTLIHILTLAAALVLFNTYKLAFNKSAVIYSSIFVLVICISALRYAYTSFLEGDALIIIDCVFLAFTTAAVSRYYKQTLLVVPILIGCMLSIIVISRFLLNAAHFDNDTTSLADIFVNLNVIAGYLLIALTLSFVLWRNSRQIGMSATALIYLGLLTTGCRSAIAIGTISIIIMLLTGFYARSKIFAVIILASMSCAVIYLKPGLLNSYFNRINWITTSIAMFTANPILGIGWGNFGSFYTAYKANPGLNSLYAHNILFQILAETGLLGLSAFVLMLIYFIKQINVKYFTENLSLYFPVALSLCGFVCYNLFDYSFYIPALTLLFFFLLGATVNVSISPRHSGSTAKLFSMLIFIVLSFLLSTPLISSVLYEHSKYYLSMNEYLLSQQYAERSLLYNNGNWQAYTKLSEIHFLNYSHTRNTADLRDAVTNQLKAIKYCPYNPSLHSDLAWLYLSGNDRDRAIVEIKNAIMLDKYNDKYKNTLMLMKESR